MAKTIEIKTDRGDIIIIPKENILFIQEGQRGINYIHLKDSKHPIETTRYIGFLKEELEKD